MTSYEHLKYRVHTLYGGGWQVIPLPEITADLGFLATYTSEEFERIKHGLLPEAMEDKWFIYYAPPWVYFHRSWTGAGFYGLCFKVTEAGASVVESWVSRDTRFYKETSVDYDRLLLTFLIDALLLGKPATYPIRASDREGTLPGARQHQMVGRAYPERLIETARVRPALDGRQDRGRGVLVGLAVGDALGMPLEFLTRQEIKTRYGGKVTNYVKAMPGHPCERLAPGQYTDDTQMALALARSLIDKGEFSPHAFKRRLVEWYECNDHRAPGNACIEAALRLDEGVSYKESGQKNAAGCGSAMRVPPLALVYRGKDLVKHSHVQSLMTHQDVRASIGAVLTAQIVSRLLAIDADSFDSDVFLQEMNEFAAALEEKLGHRNGEFSRMLAKFTNLLGMPFEEGIQAIGTSGYVVQTVLAAFYGFLHTPHDFEQTIVNVVNEGDDADSVGAIAGAFSGALNGMKAIPERWRSPLEDRETIIGIADRLFQLGSTEQ